MFFPRHRIVPVVVCLSLSLLSILAGCQSSARGPVPHAAVTPVPEPLATVLPPESPSHGVQELEIKIVAAEPDGIHPLANAKPEALLPGGGAPLREARLPEPLTIRKPLLIQWRGIQFGTLITRAHVSFISAGAGAKSQELEASYDTDVDQWRVSLAPMLGSGERELDPTALHSLNLHLDFADGSAQSYTLKFQARSTIRGVIIAHELIPLIASFDELYGLAHENFLLARDLISNPTSRKVRVWVHADSGSLGLSSYYRIQRWDYAVAPAITIVPPDRPILGPAPTADQEYSNWVQVLLAVLKVERGTESQLIPFQASGWLSFDLEPGQSARVSWQGSLSPSTRECAFPAKVIKSLKWFTPNQSVFTYTDFEERFSQQGMRLKGVWAGKLRLSEPDLSTPPDLEDAQDFTREVKSAFGADFGENLTPMECVGLYPRAGM